MKLVITEKPSVAQSIAKVIGAKNRFDGYLEGNSYIVSWCIGHLVEMVPPEGYGEIYRRWKLETLPILPEEWNHRVSEKTKKQFHTLVKLMSRKDVDSLVCATDAGREGELIFRLVYHQAKCEKPVERLWLSSMEDQAIREGFRNLKPGSEYDNLYRAALCREQADWLVGMNATRLFSCLYGQTLPMGRVMSPTLAMLAGREEKIESFVPEEHFTVKLNFQGFQATSEKLKTRAEAEAILDSCKKGQFAELVKLERKEKSEKAPQLHDLTSLQRAANRTLGYTAQQTLDYAQALYEKKLITYPRTDSKFLTDDMSDELEHIAQIAGQITHELFPLDIPSKQVCNSKKVSDHHAIIPTATAGNYDIDSLPAGEKKLLDLLCRRSLAALDKPFRYEETVATIRCGGAFFTAKGRIVLESGWKAYVEESKKLVRLPDDLAMGDEFVLKGADIQTGHTTPPEHYTEDTILSAMETAGKEDMPEDAERKGIGTPATRAGILEKLIRCGYVERRGDRKKKHLIPTAKGRDLAKVLPEMLCSAQLTARWEQMLLGIEKGAIAPDVFMDGIVEMVKVLCADTVIDQSSPLAQNASVGACPHCGAPVLERKQGYFCSGDGCKFALWSNNRFFESIGKHITREMAEKLIKDSYVTLNHCKSKRTGRNFSATVSMKLREDGSPNFSLVFANGF